MKWIGQHIWDFISRFRSDVYLEDIADPGSDTDKFLVIDTNSKVGYRTGAEVLSDIGASSESTDLEFSGDTANGVLTYGGAAQIDVESTLLFDSNLNTLFMGHSGGGSLPYIVLSNSDEGGAGPAFKFAKTANGADDDFLGKIFWEGDDVGGGAQTFAEISTQIGTAAAGDEAGKLNIKVAASDSTTSNSRQALTATGHGTNDVVDISLGYGTGSTTTVAGDLAVTKEATIPSRKFTVTGTTHFEYQGDVLYFGGGSTTQGDLCYLKENGEWGQADADGAATGDDADRDAMGMLAIALGTDPDVNGMLVKGVVTMDYDLGDVGNPIYVSTTAGDMTATAPSGSGDFVRVLGYCLDDTNGQMYFNPDNAWVEIA